LEVRSHVQGIGPRNGGRGLGTSQECGPTLMLVPAPERILVIKLRYVGDVLLATPVLSRLRESFPKAHLAMLVNPGTDDVVRDHPALDEVLVLERDSLARQWRFVRDLRR